MNNAISTQITFAQEITDKVRQLIMNAMPEEKLQGILQNEYDKYFNDKVDRYGSKELSEFSRLVQREVRTFMEAKVREMVNSYLTTLVWGNGSVEAKAILAEITPCVQHALAQDAAKVVATTFISGLQANMNRQF